MNPSITNLLEADNVLNFTIKDINVSLANALRRVILSEIPTIVFRTFPHDENDAIFEINTSRLNNEIIKQRLSCIPIHISDPEFPINDHMIEIDVNNTSSNIIYATSKDFKIKNTKSNKYLSEDIRDKIFPANPRTTQYIDFVRLRPRLSEDIPGEHLKMSCKFSIGTAKENGMFNVVSTCSYGCTLDQAQISKAWAEKEKKLLTQAKEGTGANMTQEDIKFIRDDWMLLEAKRYVVKDSFNFIIETVGVYSNLKICEMACQIIVKKLGEFINNLQTKKELIKQSISTMENSYDITLENEDYTIGKILEYVLYEKHFNREITYCGFRKAHPHLDYSIIRVAFKENIDNTEIISFLTNTATVNIEIFEKLAEEFKRD
jgi:DNA-directed RNA polymerase subunit L